MKDTMPLAKRQAFADAIAAKIPKTDLLQTIGIAESTYYKWQKRFKEYGNRWVNGELITKEKCLPFATSQTTHRRIVELSLLNPTYGPQKLAELLLTVHHVKFSPATIHNILKKNELGTRPKRVTELLRQLKEGVQLLPAQVRLVEASNPFLRWDHGKGSSIGDMLTHGEILMYRLNPFGRVKISIVVDTFDKRAFASIWGGGINLAVEVINIPD